MKYLMFKFSEPTVAEAYQGLRKLLVVKGKSIESEIESFIKKQYDFHKDNENAIVTEKEALELLERDGLSVNRLTLRYHRVNQKLQDDGGSFYFVSGRNNLTVYYEYKRLKNYFLRLKSSK